MDMQQIISAVSWKLAVRMMAQYSNQPVRRFSWGHPTIHKENQHLNKDRSCSIGTCKSNEGQSHYILLLSHVPLYSLYSHDLPIQSHKTSISGGFPKEFLLTHGEAKDCVQYCVRRALLADFLEMWSDTEFTDETSGRLSWAMKKLYTG